MKPHCYICATASDLLMEKDGYALFQCPECELVFVYPEPSGEYLAHEVSGKEPPNKGTEDKIPKKNTKTEVLLARIREFSPLLPAGQTLLDVGCSSGEFLFHAKEAGFVVSGVELNSEMALRARRRGFTVYQGTLQGVSLARNSYDVVVLSDVIEHVRDPRSLLAECGRVLRENGIIVIRMQNMDCFWAKVTLWLNRRFEIPWSSAEPPHHLYFFSWGNFLRLLKAAELTVVQTFYSRPRSLLYEVGSLHLLNQFKKEKSFRSLFFMAFSFKLYALFYIVDVLITPFKRKDFSMLVFVRKI